MTNSGIEMKEFAGVKKSTVLQLMTFSATLLGLLLSVAAQAEPQTQLQVDIDQWLKTKVHYTDCYAINGVSQQDLQATFESAIHIGIQQMERINGALITNRFELGRSQAVNVSCRQPSTGEANTILKKHFWQPRPVMSFGLAMQDHDLDLEARRSVMFHEFLHLMTFDNALALHGQSKYIFSTGLDGTSGAEKDVVYSCAVAAFPESAALYSGHLRAWVAESTCSRAYVDGDDVKVRAPESDPEGRS